MGLDIVYYRDLRKTTEDDPDASHLWVNPSFKDRADGMEDGYYKAEKRWSFRAGSYSSYNHWRNQLAILGGFDSDHDAWINHEGGPFWEIIHFSDCEGIIGPKTSHKLAIDFEAYQWKANKEGDLFRVIYNEFRKAFHNAQHSGAVLFC